jgi:ribosomal protein S18 acetylase RimI-like enzyme
MRSLMRSARDSAGALEVTVEPARPDRWDDVASILGMAEPRGCFCLYYRQSSGDYSRTPGPERVRLMQALVAEEPPPGMLAYAGGEVVGWCGFGPRTSMQRLVRSRTIPSVDDKPVWSIVCFVVRVGFRRQGVARALLAAMIDYARDHGAAGLEAYPIDPESRRVNTSGAYVGTVGMFEGAGFRKVVLTDSTSAHLPRWLMRLDL